MKYKLLLGKRLVEDALMLPLIVLGRWLAARRPLAKEYRVFFFFPFYHTGGAEKVHALIAKATGNEDCVIFFTRKSHNAAFLQKFKDSGCVIKDISKYTDNKWIYPVNMVWRGMVSGYINRQQTKPVVFNGQCNFGYKLSPWIKKGVTQIELIHSVSNFSYIRMPFLPFINKTVMISREKIAEHLRLYKDFGVPDGYAQRIQYIPNASEFEQIAALEKDLSVVKVLYSGRATPEKRSHLVARIAEAIHQQDTSVEFFMAGDDFAELDRERYAFVNFCGNISDENLLAALYRQCNVLCITSSTEGFPLAVIEGMAYGCAVLATPVGDLPHHVQPGVNGFLFSTVEDEEKIVAEGVAFLLKLKKDQNLLAAMAENNIRYAQETFGFRRFALDYQKILSA